MKISDQLKCSDSTRDPKSGVFSYPHIQGFPGGSVVKNLPGSARDTGGKGSIPGLGRCPWRRKQQPTPGFLGQKSHGQRSLLGYAPWGHRELDTTEVTEHAYP